MAMSKYAAALNKSQREGKRELEQATTRIQELDTEIIREFVKKIILYKAERVDGHRIQKIKIIWNCIGEFQTPTSHQ